MASGLGLDKAGTAGKHDATILHSENVKGTQPKMVDAGNEQANLEGFSQLVLAERELHDRLRAADARSFAALAVRLAAERGYVFTEEAVQEELQKKRRAFREKWI